MITIYCDGATSGNGKQNATGGAAYVLINERNEIIAEKAIPVIHATNNICELLAMIEACEKVKELYNTDEFHSTIEIKTDSAYIINCYEQGWYQTWKKNGWVTASKTPVKNKDLWKRLIPFFENPMFDFVKVAGHQKDNTIDTFWNNYVDGLAVFIRKKLAEGGIPNDKCYNPDVQITKYNF